MREDVGDGRLLGAEAAGGGAYGKVSASNLDEGSKMSPNAMPASNHCAFRRGAGMWNLRVRMDRLWRV